MDPKPLVDSFRGAFGRRSRRVAVVNTADEYVHTEGITL
jgi:hypothetical protein